MALINILVISLQVLLVFIIFGPWYQYYHYFYQNWTGKFLMYLTYLSVYYFLTISTLTPSVFFSLYIIYLMLELTKLEILFKGLCKLNSSEMNVNQVAINKILKKCFKRLLLVKQLVHLELICIFFLNCNNFTFIRKYCDLATWFVFTLFIIGCCLTLTSLIDIINVNIELCIRFCCYRTKLLLNFRIKINSTWYAL